MKLLKLSAILLATMLWANQAAAIVIIESRSEVTTGQWDVSLTFEEADAGLEILAFGIGNNEATSAGVDGLSGWSGGLVSMSDWSLYENGLETTYSLDSALIPGWLDVFGEDYHQAVVYSGSPALSVSEGTVFDQFFFTSESVDSPWFALVQNGNDYEFLTGNTVHDVPEPEMLALMTMGLFGLYAARRRR